MTDNRRRNSFATGSSAVFPSWARISRTQRNLYCLPSSRVGPLSPTIPLPKLCREWTPLLIWTTARLNNNNNNNINNNNNNYYYYYYYYHYYYYYYHDWRSFLLNLGIQSMRHPYQRCMKARPGTLYRHDIKLLSTVQQRHLRSILKGQVGSLNHKRSGKGIAVNLQISKLLYYSHQEQTALDMLRVWQTSGL